MTLDPLISNFFPIMQLQIKHSDHGHVLFRQEPALSSVVAIRDSELKEPIDTKEIHEVFARVSNGIQNATKAEATAFANELTAAIQSVLDYLPNYSEAPIIEIDSRWAKLLGLVANQVPINTWITQFASKQSE